MENPLWPSITHIIKMFLEATLCIFHCLCPNHDRMVFHRKLGRIVESWQGKSAATPCPSGRYIAQNINVPRSCRGYDSRCPYARNIIPKRIHYIFIVWIVFHSQCIKSFYKKKRFFTGEYLLYNKNRKCLHILTIVGPSNEGPFLWNGPRCEAEYNLHQNGWIR